MRHDHHEHFFISYLDSYERVSHHITNSRILF